MGTRVAFKGKGICKSVSLQLNDLTVTEDFLPIELGDLDIVLGI